MFHTVSVAISPHRYWGSPNMVEMVYVVSRKDESLREITVQINPTSIPHLTFSLNYAARNFSSLLSFKPFPSHVLNVRSWKLRLVEERIMVTISSTDRLDLHWSTRSPLCFAKTFVATAKRDACPTGRETAQWKRDSAGSLTMLMLYILRHNLSTKQISNQNNENKK